MPEFHKVTQRASIPEGQGRSFLVSGRRIAIFHVQGQFHAIDDVCVHRGGPLGDGSLEGSLVTCPWHAWRFDVITGRNPDDPDIGVPTYRCRLHGEDIEVEL